jgi:mono/diheme cytochrome c family protein
MAAQAIAAAPAASAVVATKKLSFNEDVQPILAENCYACHGTDPGSRKADLRLDRAEHAMRKRKDGDPAIVPGKPDESPLVRRIESKDEKKMMPPPEAHKTLRPDQIALLRQWVAEGAEYEEHWSFIAPKRPPLPSIAADQAKWIRNPVDQFILARLQREKLAPSVEADRRSLIRRVTLDLTGMVPTADEVEAFVADSSPNA